MRSFELRWFSEREIDDSLLRRFDERGELEVRDDRYLWGTGDALGVKFRGGRLETKRRDRVEALTVEVRGVAIHGVIETWRKASDPPRDPEADERWICVGKRRALRQLNQARVELTRLELSRLELPGGEVLIARSPILSSLALETAVVIDTSTLLRSQLIELLDDHPELIEWARGWSGGYPAALARAFECETAAESHHHDRS